MLTIGEELSGRYRIERILGKGGMGAVYLGVMDLLGGKKFAIKEMEFAGDACRSKEQALEQFRKEANFLANLNHPNLVRVTDCFGEADKHYLVMEYVEGETLQELLERRQKPFDWSEMQPRISELLEVLNYLHTQNPPILFRDLKPSNIMIDKSGRLKLIDFGIARTAQPGQETSTFLKGTGTSGFSPIEQYGMGETTDQRSDIYAFGATVYYLLTGKVPTDAVHRVSSGAALLPPSTIKPQLPVYLDAVLLRCLALRQANRYNCVEEIQRELSLMAGNSTVHPVADESLYHEDRGIVPGGRRSPVLTAIASVVLLMGIVLLGFSWQDILREFQSPGSMVAEAETKDYSPTPEPASAKVDPAPRNRTPEKKERNPYAYIRKLPDGARTSVPLAQSVPEPRQAGVRRVLPQTVSRPQPQEQKITASRPQLKLDLGSTSYPKANPTAKPPVTQPQLAGPTPDGREVTFFEKLPDGRKLALRHDDPRLPALRRQYQERMRKR